MGLMLASPGGVMGTLLGSRERVGQSGPEERGEGVGVSLSFSPSPLLWDDHLTQFPSFYSVLILVGSLPAPRVPPYT